MRWVKNRAIAHTAGWSLAGIAFLVSLCASPAPAQPAATAAPPMAVPAPSIDAVPPLRLVFVTHAAFFSAETDQPVAIDPQVFVRTPGAPEGMGPQGITHIPNWMPAPLAANSSSALANAQGKLLGFTLGAWLGAKGTASITPVSTLLTRVTVNFSGLVPGGLYSLFENQFTPSGVTITPLDGTGKANTFTASDGGAASMTVDVPGPLTHSNAILLVYHSDDIAHGMMRGQPGVTAHHQLIARIP